MAVDKDLEAFVDFLQERGVPVLQSLGNIDLENFDAAEARTSTSIAPTTTSAPVTGGVESEPDKGEPDAPSPSQPTISKEAHPTITKEAIVSTFLRHVNVVGPRGVGGGGNDGGGSGGSSGAAVSTGGAAGLGPQPSQQQLQQQQQHVQSQQQQAQHIQQPYGTNNSAHENALAGLPQHTAASTIQQYLPGQAVGIINSPEGAAGTGMALRTRSPPAPVADTFKMLPSGILRATTPRVCQHRDCSRRPSFNHPGFKARFCSSHRELNMVDVAHKLRCQHRNVSAFHFWMYPW